MTAAQQGCDGDRGRGDEPGGDEQGEVEPVREGGVRLGGDRPAEVGGEGDRGPRLAGLRGGQVLAQVQVALVCAGEDAGQYGDAHRPTDLTGQVIDRRPD